jgi:hypothetical protein
MGIRIQAGKKISCFEVVDVLFRGLEASPVALKSCKAGMPKIF